MLTFAGCFEQDSHRSAMFYLVLRNPKITGLSYTINMRDNGLLGYGVNFAGSLANQNAVGGPMQCIFDPHAIFYNREPANDAPKPLVLSLVGCRSI